MSSPRSERSRQPARCSLPLFLCCALHASRTLALTLGLTLALALALALALSLTLTLTLTLNP